MSNKPTMNCGVIDADAPFGHHLFQVSQAQYVGEIPTHAKQDGVLIKMVAFENWFPRDTAKDNCQTKAN
jgi:hypothetical protein